MYMKTLILIPTFNAQDTLLDTLAELETNAPDADVLFIDHGSTDRTKHQLRINDINHLILPLETSYYQALSLGMKFASKNNYDIVIEWDDKLKFEAKDIKYFITTMQRNKSDLILGSRFVNKKPGRSFRWAGTRALRRATRFATGKKITDPTFRFRAYGKKAIAELSKEEGTGPAPDTIAKLLKYNLTYREVYAELKGNHKKQLHYGYRSSVGEIFRWTSWIIFVLPFKRVKKGSA